METIFMNTESNKTNEAHKFDEIINEIINDEIINIIKRTKICKRIWFFIVCKNIWCHKYGKKTYKYCNK